MLKLDIQKFAATYTPGITLEELSWDVGTNTSYVKATYWVESKGGAYRNSPATGGASNLGGSVEDFTIPSYSFQPSGTMVRVVLLERYATIGHNADGTGSCFAEFWWDANHSDIGTVATTAAITLTTIPRATACPNLSGDIESTYNIALNPASGSFSHSIAVFFGEVAGYINGSGNLQGDEYKFSNNNINFTIPSSFYNEFAGKSGKGSIRLYTYNGNDRIGETWGEITASCLESRCRPSISGTIKDINAVTKTLTGDDNKLVKYFSNALLTLNLNPTTSANDTNSRITQQSVEGTTFDGISITLNKVTKKDFSVMVTNSRGFSTTAILTASGGLVDYFMPSITIEAYRVPDQTSSHVKMAYGGSFFNQNFGVVQNTLEIKWYWKESTSSEWTLGGNINPSFRGNEIVSGEIDCGNVYDYLNAYRFKLEVVDKLTSDGTTATDVIRGVPIYSHGKFFFQFHVPVFNKDGTLQF